LWIIRWVVALVLAVAAGLKIGGHPGAETLYGSMPPMMQWGAIGAELGLAAWLVSGTAPRVAAFAAVTLFSAFLAIILVDMNSPQPKDCGCLGKIAVAADPATRLRISLGVDVALVVLALALYYGSVRKQNASSAAPAA
jgi:hypothetical protein